MTEQKNKMIKRDDLAEIVKYRDVKSFSKLLKQHFFNIN